MSFEVSSALAGEVVDASVESGSGLVSDMSDEESGIRNLGKKVKSRVGRVGRMMKRNIVVQLCG